jgi:hypothetical protein
MSAYRYGRSDLVGVDRLPAFRLFGRLSRHTRATLGLSAVVLAVGFASVAHAEPPRLLFDGGFDMQGHPIGVAVDQSSGDLYVTGFFNPVSEPLIGEFDASGSPIKRFGSEVFGSTGAALNPTNGDLYVYDEGEIDTYDPSTGALLPPPASFPVPLSINHEYGFGGLPTVQIAADTAGNVYVPVIAENEVLEYSPTGALLKTLTGGSGVGALKGPNGVAVDASGNLWVADTGNNRIEKLSPADAPVGEIRSERVESVALDGHGDVFAVAACGAPKSPCSHLVEYDPAGSPVADVGTGLFFSSEFVALPPMVAVSESTGRVYVTSGDREKVWVFAPPIAPSVGKELSAEVGATEVKLGALVNPGGIPTSYRFEYGTSTAYGRSTPLPEGSVGEGFSLRAVWAASSGLAPGTTYHYRVVATNELGTVTGPDQTFTTLTVEQSVCPNELLRSGFSVRLPDCRAYELVTTPFKTSVQARSAAPAAADGNSLAFETNEPLPNSPTGAKSYIATRGAGGWSSEDIIPLESYTSIICNSESNNVLAYSGELSKVAISVGTRTRASEDNGSPHLGIQECNAAGLQVVPGEPVGYQNLLVRDNATGDYRLVNVTPAGVTPSDAHFKGASADLSHIVFTEMEPLEPGAPYGVEDLYEWDEGVVRLASVLPNGARTVGSLPEGVGAQDGSHAVSANGSHIVFMTSSGLYMRIDGERTVRVDEAQEGASGSNGGGVFQTASADGSRVFFTDTSRLTADATAEPGEPDLYECELVEEEQAGKRIARCELSDLTVAKAGEHADVLGVLGLGSQDSSHVYFVAKGVLAANTREFVDSEGKKVVEGAQDGQSNLYMRDGGTTTFVSTSEFSGGAVSPDGTWLAFVSSKSLTGYDNQPLSGGSPVPEIFVYSAVSGDLACVSCNPDGEAPNRGGGISSFPFNHHRPLADGGRVFFDTQEALVPSDTNGQMDVYEYENGHVYLISSGTSPIGSTFIDASENGDDVFFFTTQQLVPQDTVENMPMIYDARVDGGLPVIASPPACTTADACRSAVSPQPSIYGAPSSQTFSGEGNVPPAVQAKVKKKTKPAKKRKTGKNACGRSHAKHKRAACGSSSGKHGAHRGRKAHKSDGRAK